MYRVQEYVRGLDRWVTVEMFNAVSDAFVYSKSEPFGTHRVIDKRNRVVYENKKSHSI